MEVTLQHCQYCNKIHDTRIACPEYAYRNAPTKDQQTAEMCADVLGYWLLNYRPSRMGIIYGITEPKEDQTMLETEIKIGDIVTVYDRYRFAIPLRAKVLEKSDVNDGVRLELLQSNNVNYPTGRSDVWVSEKQVRKEASVLKEDHMEFKTGDKAIYKGQEVTIDSVCKDIRIRRNTDIFGDELLVVQPEELAPVPKTKKLSNHDKHVLMWDWLAKNPHCDKKDAIDALPQLKGDTPINNCYACQQSSEGYGSNCKKCPIIQWRGQAAHSGRCEGSQSPYCYWKHAENDISVKSHTAAEIRDMEWQEVAKLQPEKKLMTNHDYHKYMWNWLADHPDKDKEDAMQVMRSLFPELRTVNCTCFACKEQTRRYGMSCCVGGTCPIVVWRGGGGCCASIAAFDQWRRAHENRNWSLTSQLAREIANLEWE